MDTLKMYMSQLSNALYCPDVQLHVWIIHSWPYCHKTYEFPTHTPKLLFPIYTPKLVFPIYTPKLLFPIYTPKLLFPIYTPKLLFPTHTQKLPYHVYSGYKVVIGYFSNKSTKHVLQSFITVRPGLTAIKRLSTIFT